jgi:hypothetical protein
LLVSEEREAVMLNFGKMNAAKKKMMKRALGLVGVYYAVFLAAFLWAMKAHPGVRVMAALAVATAAPIVGVMAVMGRYLKEEPDEYHRELVTRCLLWGSGAVLTSVSIHLFLELYGWTGHWSPLVELIVFVLAMGAAKVSYRVANRLPEEGVEAGSRE